MRCSQIALFSWLGTAAIAAAALGLDAGRPAQAGPAAPVPPPAYNPPDASASETATLSGGCFWGLQGVYEHVKGVEHVYAGYTGGSADSAKYEIVSTGETGHAESVQITFNPRVISYGEILRIYFSVASDPTELNFQGPDSGKQYRSEIWVATPQQKKIAAAYIAQLNGAHAFAAPIVVRIDPAQPFYQAEDYHQDFLVRHPDQPYVAENDIPKVQSLAQEFPKFYQATPVTVFPSSG